MSPALRFAPALDATFVLGVFARSYVLVSILMLVFVLALANVAAGVTARDGVGVVVAEYVDGPLSAEECVPGDVRRTARKDAARIVVPDEREAVSRFVAAAAARSEFSRSTRRRVTVSFWQLTQGCVSACSGVMRRSGRYSSSCRRKSSPTAQPSSARYQRDEKQEAQTLVEDVVFVQ